MKRALEVVDGDVTGSHGSKSSPRPRRQDPVSCQFCRKKKLKCDRGAPCSNCVTRKLICSSSLLNPTHTFNSATQPRSELDLPGIYDNHVTVDLLSRVERLEALLTSKNRAEQDQPSKNSPIVAASIKPQNSELPLTHRSPDEVELANTVTWLENDVVSSEQQISTTTTKNTDIAEDFRSFVTSIATPFSTAPIDQTRLKILPSRKQGHALLDYFLREISWQYHIIHAPTVREHLDAIYDSIENEKPLNYGILTLICTIFTLSAYFSPNTGAEHNITAIAWGRLAQDALSVSDCISKPSIETLQSIILIGVHIIPNVIGSVWMMRILTGTQIQLARALQLDQIDSRMAKRKRKTGDVDWVQVEVGRRIWWHIVSVDWFMCFIAGVPWPGGSYMIQRKQMNVDVPSNTDDILITASGNYDQPLSIYTDSTFIRFRIEVANVFREIADATWDAGGSADDISYDLLLELDKRLNTLAKALSQKLDIIESESMKRLAPDDVSGMRKLRHLISRQNNTNILCIHTRISRLHRPYLVRGAQDPHYTYSRMSCLRSARIVIESSKAIMATTSKSDAIKFVALGHHMFVSTVILLMDYYFDRDEPQKKQRMEEILDALKVLETSQDQNTIATRGLQRLHQILKKHPESKSADDHEPRENQPNLCSDTAQFTPVPSPDSASMMPPWLEIDFSMFGSINFDAGMDPSQFESYFLGDAQMYG
ncbi:hypothetical protein B0O99DRAFT_677143 [Bisporella sp. PMI_857]|nr:hypothetical protein B0O99DRAFT_677143 [Bisporella sp. PMI_857]